MKICDICGNLLEMNFFFELLSGRNSKTVNLFAWFLGMVCPSKRYSLWINQEKPRIRNLVKNNLIYGCIFSCERGCWCPFFRPPGETYIGF